MWLKQKESYTRNKYDKQILRRMKVKETLHSKLIVLIKQRFIIQKYIIYYNIYIYINTATYIRYLQGSPYTSKT